MHTPTAGNQSESQAARKAIDAALRRVGLRLWLSTFLRHSVVALTGAVVIALLVRIFERVLGFDVPWLTALPALAGAAVLAAIVSSIATRPGRKAAALALDEAAGLDEQTLTADWALSGAGRSGWRELIIREASARLSGESGKRAVAAVRIEGPRSWPTPLFAVGVAIAAWWAVPSLDLLGATAEREAEEDARRELIETAQQIEAQDRELRRSLAEAGIDPDNALEESAGEAETAEGLRRERLRQLTSLRDRIESQRAGRDAERVKALKEAARRLKRPGPGPLDEFARQLARGDLRAAQAQLRELAENLGQGDMDAADKQRVQEQIENLADQLENVRENRNARVEELAKKLGEQAGIDPEQARQAIKDAAQNPDQLRQKLQEALENGQIDQEQLEQMMEQAQGIAEGLGDAQQLAEAMQQAAEAMQQQGEGGEGGQAAADAFANAARALGEAAGRGEQQGALDEAADAAMAQLEALGGNPGGDPNGQPGPPGPGQGQGEGFQDLEDVDTMAVTTERRADIETTDGPIIGTKFVYESQIRGESQAAFAEAARASEAEAAEAIEEGVVPPEFRDAVKRYFGRVRKAAEAKPAEREPDKPEPETP